MSEVDRYEFVFVNDSGEEFPASERLEFDGEYVKYEALRVERDAALARETALREELSNHDSASKLISAWAAEKGTVPWVTAVSIMAIATKMPDSERQGLLDLDDGSAELSALQQRLTKAENLLREVSEELWQEDDSGDIFERIDAALNPVEGEGS